LSIYLALNIQIGDLINSSGKKSGPQYTNPTLALLFAPLVHTLLKKRSPANGGTSKT
jgi:hypothetical protein